jgi:aspartate/glutamate racemase
LPETKAALLVIMDRMKARKQVDSIMLAGTELPILRQPVHDGIPIIDTMRVDAAADEMFCQ